MITPPNILKLMARGAPGMAARAGKRVHKELVENPVVGTLAAGGAGVGVGALLTKLMGGSDKDGDDLSPEELKALLELLSSRGG